MNKEEIIKEFRNKFVKEYYITDINQEINFEEIEIFLLSKLQAQEKEHAKDLEELSKKLTEEKEIRQDERNRLIEMIKEEAEEVKKLLELKDTDNLW